MNIFKRIRNLFSFGSDNVPKGVNPEHVEACRRIIKNGGCGHSTTVICPTIEKTYASKEYAKCPLWSEKGCNSYEDDRHARKWLADHGIKE